MWGTGTRESLAPRPYRFEGTRQAWPDFSGREERGRCSRAGSKEKRAAWIELRGARRSSRARLWLNLRPVSRTGSYPDPIELIPKLLRAELLSPKLQQLQQLQLQQLQQLQLQQQLQQQQLQLRQEQLQQEQQQGEQQPEKSHRHGGGPPSSLPRAKKNNNFAPQTQLDDSSLIASHESSTDRY